MQRALKEETGYRCAVPNCRESSSLVLAHIVPWSQVREHTFDNLICLCSVCHSKYDTGVIPRQSVLVFKANLSVLNNRYGDLERRILLQFSERPNAQAIYIDRSMLLLVKYLIDDGYLKVGPGPELMSMTDGMGNNVAMGPVLVVITTAGRAFIDRWLAADTLE